MVEGPRSKSFLGYIHSLRGLAILMVVTLHVGDAEGWSDSSWGTRFIFLILTNATIPFMFVSGFLFQHLSARFNYTSYLRGRLSKLIVPYVVISIPTLSYQYLKHRGIFSGAAGDHPLRTVIWAYSTGAHMAIPLWYIPVIVLFNIASPVWLMMDRRPRWYYLIIPGLIVSAFIHRSYGHIRVLQSAVYFLPVYLAGMWVSHYRTQVHEFTTRRWGWLLGITGALLAFEFVGQKQVGPIYSYQPFSMDHGVFDVDIFAKLLLTMILAELLRRHDASVRGWLAGFADASFGMFFLHKYAILSLQFIAASFDQAALHQNLTLIAVSVPIVIASTFLVVIGAQRLLGQRSRFVIGS